jgi:hypothetical protein
LTSNANWGENPDKSGSGRGMIRLRQLADGGRRPSHNKSTMIRLNLLAEELKQKIRQRRLYFLFIKTELSLLLLIFTSGIIFLAADEVLSANILKFGVETSLRIKISNDDYNLEIKKINDKLALVAEIQKGFISYSQLLKNITALAPNGVSFSYLKINTPAKTIKIRGRALLRENLLALEKNLKNAPFLTKVGEIPFADKLKKENIDFDIDLGFDLTKI